MTITTSNQIYDKYHNDNKVYEHDDNNETNDAVLLGRSTLDKCMSERRIWGWYGAERQM